MKKESVNQFNGGLNVDLHPMVTPNSVLTDDLNGTFITYNGNEFCLQNDKGNFEVAQLSDGYIPIGAKEYNGIIYIVSVKNALNENGLIDVKNCETEIGTYPGVDWNVPYEKECSLITPENKPEGKECYTVLQNIDVVDDEENNIATSRGKFSGLHLGYSTITPVTIEIQPSYDGSVNLILTDGVNPVRMINSGFSVLPNDKYKLIKRHQSIETNEYDSLKLQDLELIRNSAVLSNVDLVSVTPGGQLKGGNYTFYIKFGDGDYNQTDVVAESGIVSIFKGTDGDPTTISGTLLDERTDKAITLEVTGKNPIYSKIYVYYTREYSDTLGYRLTEAAMLKEPYDMNSDKIYITGYEQTETINIEELNIDYHTFNNARAMAQQQSMLFLGNLSQNDTYKLYNDLERITSLVTPKQKQNLNLTATQTDFSGGSEYYSTKNIYNYVGYWPDEYYRFGIVYILKDGSTTPVFNTANKGVVKTTRVGILGKDYIKPISFEFDLSGLSLPPEVIGYFVVRQKRIPITLCQGLSIGIDQRTHLPITWNGANWITESFISCNRDTAYKYASKSMHDDSSTWDANITEAWSIFNHANKDKYSGNLYPYPRIEYTNSNIFKEVSNIEHPNYLWQRSDPEMISVTGSFDNWFDSFGRDNSDYYISTNVISENYGDLDTYSVYKWIYEISYEYNNSIGSYESTSLPDKTIIFITDNSADSIENIASNLKWYNDRIPSDVSIVVREPSYYNTTTNLNSAEDDKFKFISYGHTPKEATVEDRLNGSGLLCLDASTVPTVRNILDGSKFTVRKEYSVSTAYGSSKDTYYSNTNNNSGSYLLIKEDISSTSNDNGKDIKCVYVPINTKVKVVDNYAFSTVAGDKADATSVEYVSENLGIDWKDGKNKTSVKSGYRWCAPVTAAPLNQFESGEHTKDTRANDNLAGFNSHQNINVVRGLFTPFVGLTSNDIRTNTNQNMGIYSIRLQDVDSDGNQINQSLVREQDESPYYAVSNRVDTLKKVNVYRGDCFSCTVGNRILTNFIDSTAPAAEVIADPNTWKWFISYHPFSSDDNDETSGKNNLLDINLSDVNTSNLGYWVTYKCLSSYNLGLRSLDYSNEQEQSLLGSPRSFFPLNGGSTSTGNKMLESIILNDGYSATVGEKRFILNPDVPYQKSEFANRIIFSNVQVDDSFTNGYRTFQGLSYQDYDKQYGEIVKLVPWDNNLLVVMEHGIGVVGVNEQALIQTNTADTIHIYGHGVLSDHMQMISQDYGSKYEHSVIRTPIGVYGIDTDARKVWRVSTQKGFETLSDMKIESYLNDELGTNTSIDLPLIDVRTHYNATKGDIMFTFFKKNKDFTPKEIVTPKEGKYFNINLSEVTMGLNDTITIPFYTNYTEDEIKVSNIIGLINGDIDWDKQEIILTSTGTGDGNVKISINDSIVKEKPIHVKSESEIYQDQQNEISNQSNTTTETVTDEETGESTVVVTSKAKIKTNILESTLIIGRTYRMNVTITNNQNNIKFDDCTLTINPKSTGTAKIVRYSNGFDIIPQTVGTWQITITHPNAHGIELQEVNIVESRLWLSDDGSTIYKGGYGNVRCFNWYHDITVTANNDNIKYGNENSQDWIWFFGEKLGDTILYINDGKTTIEYPVHVREPKLLEGYDWYWVDPDKYWEDGQYTPTEWPTTITMKVGEKKALGFNEIPEDYDNEFVDRGIGVDKGVGTVITLKYIWTHHYSNTGGILYPWIEISAVGPGEGVFYSAIYRDKRLYKKYECKVIVTDE